MDQSYQTILVGIDGSSQSDNAYKSAIEVARINQGRVIIATVIQNDISNFLGYSNVSEDFFTQAKNKWKLLLDERVLWAKEVDFHKVETIVIQGNPKEVLSKQLPEKYNVDLIMVGQSGLNVVERFMIGSVSKYIIAHALCDVLVIHSKNI
jgi:nucleotide-binding universal stress UspA family protein